MDDAVGALLDALERLDLLENTIIVFTSDNGGNMYNELDGTVRTSNQPWRGGKATMYEGGTRVPCVIAWPGKTQPGSRSDAMIQSEDFYPTLIAGIQLPVDPAIAWDGVDFTPALRGEPLERQAIFQYFPHSPPVPGWLPPSVSIHQGQWKLVRIFHGSDGQAHRYLLYDLESDPDEQNNLETKHPDLVKELDALIDSFLKNTSAVVPIANTAFDPARYDPKQEGKPKPNKKKAGPGSRPAKSSQ